MDVARVLSHLVIGARSTQFIQSQWRPFQARRAEQVRWRQIMADRQACVDSVMPR